MARAKEGHAKARARANRLVGVVRLVLVLGHWLGLGLRL